MIQPERGVSRRDVPMAILPALLKTWRTSFNLCIQAVFQPTHSGQFADKIHIFVSCTFTRYELV